MGKQFNIRDMPERSDAQLRQLVEWTGYTKVQIMLLGLDKFWQELRKEREEMTTAINFSAILEKFLMSDDFKAGVISATKASWGGSGYSVELFPDGTWRTLWSNQIGNKYNSSGVILGLPTFTDDGTYEEAVNGENPMPEEEYFDLCFANEEEELKQDMKDRLSQHEVAPYA